MGCVNPDGTVSTIARKVLGIVAGGGTAPEIAAKAEVPLYRIRASLRELAQGGLLVETDGTYALTDAGKNAAG